MITTFVEHFDDSTKVFLMFVCVCVWGGGGCMYGFLHDNYNLFGTL